MTPTRFATTATSLAVLTAGLAAAPAFANGGSMATGTNGFTVQPPVLTIGETISGTTGALNSTTAGDYTPVGILDGIGAFALDATTVRLFVNEELLNNRGHGYQVDDGQGGTFTLQGARVSYFDIDTTTRQIVDAGLAYHRIHDATGAVATDTSFLLDGFLGFSRFCSSRLVEAGQYGFEDTIYFTGEEDGSPFNPVGGAQWALDAASGEIWQVPALGHGAWENVAPLATGDEKTVALLHSDDTSPLDFSNPPDGALEAAPLYLYVGKKQKSSAGGVEVGSGGGAGGDDFLARNGLAKGKIYVWVSDTGETSPLEFRGSGTLHGHWVKLNNNRVPGRASEDGTTGYDAYGYPTQGNLFLQAKAVGAFGFSRPEDIQTNPGDGTEAVLASTGVDTYAVDPVSGNGADTFGTLYTIKTDFENLTADVTILYDGDADPARALRSPDNVEWTTDGYVYSMEDKAETQTLTGEPLFGPGAVNPDEAGIVRIEVATGAVTRIANLDRSVVLDGSLADPEDAVDNDVGTVGAWESSGILDVSTLFGNAPGTLFLFVVQAHGIDDQDAFNMTSRITDTDLAEGGQLLFLEQ